MFELTATTMWVLGGLLTIIFVLVNHHVLGKMQAELDNHSNSLLSKADYKTMESMEHRWKEALDSVKENSKDLIDRLESRHDREILELGARLGEQISRSEDNILAQIRLMVDTLKQ